MFPEKAAPLPLLMDMKKSAKTTAMIAMSYQRLLRQYLYFYTSKASKLSTFMTMLRPGPEVSLKGSPTVSPITHAACIFDRLPVERESERVRE
jgi:hypothetical protein